MKKKCLQKGNHLKKTAVPGMLPTYPVRQVINKVYYVKDCYDTILNLTSYLEWEN